MYKAGWRKLIARLGVALGSVALVVLVGPAAHAQQVNVGTPFNSVGHSFYENIGTSWGARGPGWFFNFGGGGAAPPFGGFDPNAGANFGVGFGNGNVGGGFNLSAGQGANSTFVSQTPSVTIPNGGNGVFIDGSFRPFVTSVTPIVGTTDNSDPSPLRERLRRLKSGEVQVQSPGDDEPKSEPAVAGGGGGGGRGSSAERGAQSVAALKAQAAAAQQSEDTELAALLEKAKGAEAAGKPSVARIYYQMAARRATGDQQREILTHLQSLNR